MIEVRCPLCGGVHDRDTFFFPTNVPAIRVECMYCGGQFAVKRDNPEEVKAMGFEVTE